MAQNNAVVRVYDPHAETEAAIKQLQSSGFDAVMAGGLSALDAGLYSIGVSKNSIMEYETALKSDKFLVIAHGTADEMAKAKSILETTRAAQVAAHRG